MIAALGRAAGPDAVALIESKPDPGIARIVTSWPAAVRADRAERLGLAADPDFDSVVAQHIGETAGR
jgi:D-erythronate 2-dehydrogenase